MLCPAKEPKPIIVLALDWCMCSSVACLYSLQPLMQLAYQPQPHYHSFDPSASAVVCGPSCGLLLLKGYRITIQPADRVSPQHHILYAPHLIEDQSRRMHFQENRITRHTRQYLIQNTAPTQVVAVQKFCGPHTSVWGLSDRPYFSSVVLTIYCTRISKEGPRHMQQPCKGFAVVGSGSSVCSRFTPRYSPSDVK